FYISSRRRHTRFSRDWSSDVCSSDLDRGLGGREQIRQMARVIRHLRPRVVLAPYPRDRHPDHVAAGQMVKEAVFDAGIRKLDVGDRKSGVYVNTEVCSVSSLATSASY